MASTTHQRTLEGVVVSTAMAKTCVVLVERMTMHPKYHKAYRMRTKYKVHDPANSAKVGDRVTFVACRPISKEKRWTLVQQRPAMS